MLDQTCKRDGEPATTPPHEGYDWCASEERWQAAWRDASLFTAPPLNDGQRGRYIFCGPPFTSGGAHMGHVRSYTIADAYARYLRASGEPVLFAMGFDSFGLPAELGAIRTQVQPREFVARCCEQMRQQFDAVGFSFDWDRAFLSSDADLYRWSQWLFVQLLERDLVYQRMADVDWCDSCETVLARLQVEDGCCWRCGNGVRLVSRPQWFLRASRYLAECDAMLPTLGGFDRNALGSQEALLGRTDGFEFEARSVVGQGLTVFAPNTQDISSAGFVALALTHPELDAWATSDEAKGGLEQLRSSGWLRSERSAHAATFLSTGAQVTLPGVDHMLPVIVAPYVDSRFGSTAVLGLPEQDAMAAAIVLQLVSAPGLHVRVSDRKARGEASVRFAASDFPISRQRAWGAPLPLVHCEGCGTVPVPPEELPVRLPEDLRFTGEGNPLVAHPTFSLCVCPRCGGEARRDTDTLDCHVDGLWMWAPMCVPAAERAVQMFDHPQLHRWMPAHQVVFGLDGGSYILGQRTCAKMLRDGGMLTHMQNGEPYERALMHGMIEHEGRKMSKHLGNGVDPMDIVARVGADTLRLAVMYAAAPKNSMSWSERDVDHCHRFVNRLWRYVNRWRDALRDTGDEVDQSTKLRRQLVKWCEIATRKLTKDLAEMQMHRAVRNVMLLLRRIEDFEQRARLEDGSLSEADERALAWALLRLVRVIAPLAPHLAEELWATAGKPPFVCSSPWPTVATRGGEDVLLDEREGALDGERLDEPVGSRSV
jgi:leucyl-tRNA synthetase